MNGINYSEYSFNELDETNLNSIVENIKLKLNKVDKEISVNSYEVVEEDEINHSFYGEVGINPEDISSEVILKDLIEIKDAALTCSELVVNFQVTFNTFHISKLYMSNKKELEQSYLLGEGYLLSIARRDEKTKYFFKTYSGLRGYELISDFKRDYKEVVDQSVKLLDAKAVQPGEYDDKHLF